MAFYKLSPQHDSKLFMYSGTISYPDGKFKLMDVAISLSREGRYAGAGMRWWPVLLHSFVVCDLLPKPLKIHGLLHDSPECVTGDIPKPSKTDENKALEDKLLVQIYQAFDIPFPTKAVRKTVKKADIKAFRGEVYTVGTQALQDENPRCIEAENLIIKYIHKYTYADCLEAGGLAPIDFMKRFREYKDYIK